MLCLCSVLVFRCILQMLLKVLLMLLVGLFGRFGEVLLVSSVVVIVWLNSFGRLKCSGWVILQNRIMWFCCVLLCVWWMQVLLNIIYLLLCQFFLMLFILMQQVLLLGVFRFRCRCSELVNGLWCGCSLLFGGSCVNIVVCIFGIDLISVVVFGYSVFVDGCDGLYYFRQKCFQFWWKNELKLVLLNVLEVVIFCVLCSVSVLLWIICQFWCSGFSCGNFLFGFRNGVVGIFENMYMIMLIGVMKLEWFSSWCDQCVWILLWKWMYSMQVMNSVVMMILMIKVFFFSRGWNGKWGDVWLGGQYWWGMWQGMGMCWRGWLLMLWINSLWLVGCVLGLSCLCVVFIWL